MLVVCFIISCICHTLLQNPQKMSQIGKWDCPVCFSTLHSQQHIVCTRAKSKIQKSIFTKQVAAPAMKVEEARGQSFPATALAYFFLDQTIRMKIRSTDVCQKPLQIYGKWKTAFRPNCANGVFQQKFILVFPH